MQSTTKKGRSCLAQFWLDGHFQLRNDIRTSWRLSGLKFLAAMWVAGVCLSLAILLQLGLSKRWGVLRKYSFEACQPDGTFSLFPQDYDYFSKSGFFQITLGHGQLSFTQAKVIDVAWDIVCGRGGQVVVAFVSWRVFANYVTTSMEVAPVTFSTYRTVFLQNESMFTAIPRLLRDFTRRRGLHSKVAMAFMIATMFFIWSFPSFASSMTGYSGNVKAYIQDDDSNYIPFNTFRRPLFIVHDGDRIGENKDYIVFDDLYLSAGSDTPDIFRGNSTRCLVLNYVRRYGPDGWLQSNSSVFSTITLEPPILNISAYYVPYKHVTQKVWMHDNTTYSLDHISNQGTCQPIETYQWGFSYIQLIIMLIFCLIWATGISCMHIHAYYTMKHRGRTDVAGVYKATLELAHAMNTHLLTTGEFSTKEILALTESELHTRLDKDNRGGAVAYDNPLVLDGNEKGGVGFKSWIRKEAWWLSAIFVLLGCFCSPVMMLPFAHFWGLPGFPAGLILAVCVSESGPGRGVMLFWLALVLGSLITVGTVCGLPG
ncbi:hypothetical protein T440DRAFT_556724 [Plenodomus tracheiphilus IPT5]|uniref:Uncharacterized protein n=1 Tax=Plenodomus tracheiphilus IPT5 TaxID=1408161 RepID=A0A6A7AZ62_9PLEO|nr:hypothetical protein T440DRAFT_556724 [Plenodomus tracheiphilus IPT5]